MVSPGGQQRSLGRGGLWSTWTPAVLNPPGLGGASIVAHVSRLGLGLVLHLSLLIGAGGRHVGEVDDDGLVAGHSAAAADGALVGVGAHEVDGGLAGEGPLEALVAEKLADLARPALAHPFSQLHVANPVAGLVVDVVQAPVAFIVHEVCSEGAGDAGERVEDLVAAALLALKLVDAALAVGGDLADGGIFLG